jgi:hypothetical protein
MIAYVKLGIWYENQKIKSIGLSRDSECMKVKACMLGYMLHGNRWASLEHVQGLDLTQCALMMIIIFYWVDNVKMSKNLNRILIIIMIICLSKRLTAP